MLLTTCERFLFYFLFEVLIMIIILEFFFSPVKVLIGKVTLARWYASCWLRKWHLHWIISTAVGINHKICVSVFEITINHLKDGDWQCIDDACRFYGKAQSFNDKQSRNQLKQTSCLLIFYVIVTVACLIGDFGSDTNSV